MRRAAALVIALSAAAACKRGASPPVATAPPDAAPAREVIFIDDMSVEVPLWPAPAGAQPDARTVAGRIWETLLQSEGFEAAGRGPARDAGPTPGTVRRHARLKVEIGVEKMPAATGRPAVLRAGASLALTWSAGEDDEEEIPPWAAAACDGEVPPDEKSYPGAATSLVECALTQAARGLADKAAVRRGDEGAVMMALESSDPSLRQVAFAVIAERKMTSAVPRLLEMLKSSDVLVRDGAIGALVALREQRAIKPLTDLASFNDLNMMRRIIDAVGAIGGDDARAYLELVASGHELPAVRELAADALSRLNRRTIDAGP